MYISNDGPTLDLYEMNFLGQFHIPLGSTCIFTTKGSQSLNCQSCGVSVPKTPPQLNVQWLTVH